MMKMAFRISVEGLDPNSFFFYRAFEGIVLHTKCRTKRYKLVSKSIYNYVDFDIVGLGHIRQQRKENIIIRDKRIERNDTLRFKKQEGLDEKIKVKCNDGIVKFQIPYMDCNLHLNGELFKATSITFTFDNLNYEWSSSTQSVPAYKVIYKSNYIIKNKGSQSIEDDSTTYDAKFKIKNVNPLTVFIKVFGITYTCKNVDGMWTYHLTNLYLTGDLEIYVF